MSEQKKMGPQEFSEALFNALNDASGTAIIVHRRIDDFPWTGVEEDHVEPEAAIAHIYEAMSLKPPRFAWAPSPAAMYTAINMLRSVQSGQKYKFIEALVPADDPIAAAKRTLLDGIIDRTVTTGMGAAIRHMIKWDASGPLWVWDLRNFLGEHHFNVQIPGWHPPGYRGPSVDEVTLYPAEHTHPFNVLWPLKRQTLSFVPYVHICFISRPPVAARLYLDDPNNPEQYNHLEYMRFSDGYEISLPAPGAKDVLELEDGQEYTTPPMLMEGSERKIIDRIERRCMFAMCALRQCDKCSGQIVDENIVTSCTCKCHQKTLPVKER